MNEVEPCSAICRPSTSTPPVALRARSIAASIASLPLTRNSDFCKGGVRIFPRRSCSSNRSILRKVLVEWLIVRKLRSTAAMVVPQRRRHLARPEIEVFLTLGVDDPDAACGGNHRLFLETGHIGGLRGRDHPPFGNVADPRPIHRTILVPVRVFRPDKLPCGSDRRPGTRAGSIGYFQTHSPRKRFDTLNPNRLRRLVQISTWKPRRAMVLGN